MLRKPGAKHLSAAFLKSVGEYMLVETPLRRADACIVFGNNQHADHLAAQAADLYKQGYFDTVVVSGGLPMSDGRLECGHMRDVLLAKGVPDAAILREDASRNTGENIVNSRALLEREKGIGTIKSVLAIGHIHASRRFLMTIQKHWPEVTKMFTTTNCFSVPKDLWYTDPAFKDAVLDEYAKIAPYKAKGYIAEVDMKALNKKAEWLPKPAAPKP